MAVSAKQFGNRVVRNALRLFIVSMQQTGI